MMPVLSPDPKWRAISGGRQARGIVVGLVNNMPDSALRSTERQFRELLTEAAGAQPITLRMFSFPGLDRSDAGREYVRDHHEALDELWDADLDGLIVTGTEPRAADLADEPYWPALATLVDWAAEHTLATIWSCLATHAAVRRLDGIERRPRPAKLSGVFEFTQTAGDPLLGYLPARWLAPHSRCNDLDADDLVASGYQILGHGNAAGADMFAKRAISLFLFLQGHPEYDAGALLREYRRDVERFLAGTVDRYPELPSGYFDGAATRALLAYREQVLRNRDATLLSCFPMQRARQNLLSPWRAAAVRLYSNWLSYLGEMKSCRPIMAGPLRAKLAQANG